jgi:uncharacterized protein YrrD
MQHSICSLIGYAIRATDCDLGAVDEFYFDDETWAVRYIVVETGNWLSNRRVLISPVALDKIDEKARKISVNLTGAQVDSSPDIDTKRPVYLQHEAALHEHYQWPWRGGYGGTFGTTPMPLPGDDVSLEPKITGSERRDDPHLRSTGQVTSYHIHATDGEIGHVDDFIVDDENWEIRFLVADTRNWLPGKKVLIRPQSIARVEWADSSVHLNLTRKSIENSTEFISSKLDKRKKHSPRG